MKSLRNVFFSGMLGVLLGSCTGTDIQENNPREKNSSISLIEKFFHKGASFEEIKKILGEPSEMYSYKDIPEKIYAYNKKTNRFKKWSFGVDKAGKVVWLNYKPRNDNNSLLDRVEILPQTWKKYRCKKVSVLNTSNPRITYEDTFFECAGGKIKAHYNVHGEIGIIEVER